MHSSRQQYKPAVDNRVGYNYISSGASFEDSRSHKNIYKQAGKLFNLCDTYIEVFDNQRQYSMLDL